MAQSSNPYSPAGSPWAVDTSGAFAEYLQNSQNQPQQSKAQLTGQEGKGTRIAYYLDKFLEGAQKGRYQAQTRELAKERQVDNTVNTYLQLLQDKDPVQADKVRTEIMTERGKQALALLSQSEKGQKGKGKDGQKQMNPMIGILKNVGEGMLGGPVNKYDRKDLNEKVGSWATQIANMPSRTEGQRETTNALNTAVQDVMSRTQNASGRKPYFDEIATDPKVAALRNTLQSRYGVDPAKEQDWERVYGRDPNAGKNKDQIAAEAATYKLQAERATAELAAVKGLSGGTASPPAGGIPVPGLRGGVAGTIPAQAVTGGGAPQGQLTPQNEQRLRNIPGAIEDREITLGNRTGIQAKLVTGQGQNIIPRGWYTADNKRIPDAEIAAQSGKQIESPQEARKEREEDKAKDRADRETERRQDMATRQNWHIDDVKRSISTHYDTLNETQVRQEGEDIQKAITAATQLGGIDNRTGEYKPWLAKQVQGIKDRYDALGKLNAANKQNELAEAEGRRPKSTDSLRADVSKAFNNPGMMKDTSGKFMAFENVDQGWAEEKKRLNNWIAGNNSLGLGPESTLFQLYSKWAPAGDGANDPVAGAAAIARRLGVTPETKLKDLQPRLNDLAAAIASLEGRTDPKEIERLRGTPAGGGLTLGNLVKK